MHLMNICGRPPAFPRMNLNQRRFINSYLLLNNFFASSVPFMASKAATSSSSKQPWIEDSILVVPITSVRDSKFSHSLSPMKLLYSSSGTVNQSQDLLRSYVLAVIVAVIVTAAVTSFLVAVTFYLCQKYRSPDKVQNTIGSKDAKHISENSLSSSLEKSVEFSSHALSSCTERLMIIFYNIGNRGFTIAENKGLNAKDCDNLVMRGSDNVVIKDKDTGQETNADTSCSKHCAESLSDSLKTETVKILISNSDQRGTLTAEQETKLSILSGPNSSSSVAPSVAMRPSLPTLVSSSNGLLQPSSGSLPVPSLPPSPQPPPFHPANGTGLSTVTACHSPSSPTTSPALANSSICVDDRPLPPPPLPLLCFQQHPVPPFPFPGIGAASSPSPSLPSPRDLQDSSAPPHSGVDCLSSQPPPGVKGSVTLPRCHAINNPRNAPGSKSAAYPFPPQLQSSVRSQLLKKMANANKEDLDKPKLKPLHWEKVKFDASQSMVWDRLRTGSFVLNEEVIEGLFGHKASKKAGKQTGPSVATKTIGIIDARKAQNIAIQLRALNMRKEDICDALLEGDGLSCEILEVLVKMSPTQEELKWLQVFSNDISQLGPAERFLKGLVEVPFAFERVKAMLFKACFKDDLLHVKECLRVLEVACADVRNNRLFIKILEAVLKAGNHMNAGTFRGDAAAFKLDALLKLSDIKSVDGKTTLLCFVIEEIMKAEGVRGVCMMNDIHASLDNEKSDDDYKRIGLHVISSLSADLGSVRKAAGVDADALSQAVSKLANGIGGIKDLLTFQFQSEVDSMEGISDEDKFHQHMLLFVNQAEEDINHMQNEISRVFDNVKHVTAYFHGNLKEAQPLHLFQIVADFLQILDKICGDLASALKVSHRT